MSVEKYKLESEIRELIFDDNRNSAHFEYSDHGHLGVNVKLVTLNKKTNATFLLTEMVSTTEIEALQNILKYLSEDRYHSFTIKWYEKGIPTDRPNKSKFRAQNIIAAIEKFYYGRNKDSLVIYSISDDNVKSKDYEG